jgi:hypothetical protein
MFESDLYAYWAAHPTLSSIPLEPGRLSENPVFPTATYSRISGPYSDNNHTTPGEVVDARIQFSVYDDDWLACWQAANKVKAVFKRFHGTMGTTEVQSTRIDSDNDAEDSETKMPRRLIDIFFRYREVLS